MEISLTKTELADVFLLKHGPEPLNIQPRDSRCAFRGVHFVEDSCFVLGFERRQWVAEKGTAFLTERDRVHRYGHVRGAPPDVVLSVRFSPRLVQHMSEELPDFQFERLDSWLGARNDLRYLRWRLDRLPAQCRELAADEWVVDLVMATYVNGHRSAQRPMATAQLTWYAERIEEARQQLIRHFAREHRLDALARSVAMSTFQFARVFRELVGVPPHAFLLDVRYRAALRMLMEGASVTSACFDAGFSNLSHFTRQFKRRFGQSPSTVKTAPQRLRAHLRRV